MIKKIEEMMQNHPLIHPFTYPIIYTINPFYRSYTINPFYGSPSTIINPGIAYDQED